ncbi:MAG: response regulator transcription factor [Patescibacteria group bacterium]|jgi:DNA-binding response OmpR family regulator
MKILIVEDEESIREVLKEYLMREGFVVEEAISGEVALLKFNSSVNLVVLDLNLPNRDGIEVAKAIRKKSSVPIIMVTARTEESDELKGLSIGADDYIKKPFSPKVLMARIQTLLRRTDEPTISSNGLKIDEEKMLVIKNGEEIPLTTTQFKILHTLAKQPGKVFTRSELLSAVEDDNGLRQAMERTIDAHIKTIRKLIDDDPQKPKYIKTIIGTGYKFTNET